MCERLLHLIVSSSLFTHLLAGRYYSLDSCFTLVKMLSEFTWTASSSNDVTVGADLRTMSPRPSIPIVLNQRKISGSLVSARKRNGMTTPSE